jgi:phage protein D/phage baseplate assembly protein gpV
MGKYQYNPTIKIGGSEVSQQFYDSVDEVVVDTTLHMPDMFTIQLHDPTYQWVDNTLLDIGKEVEISVETEYGSVWPSAISGVIFKGEITALEPRFSVTGATKMVVRGYDKSHRLHRGNKTRTFLQQKDSDLVSTLAGEAGLSAQVDATTVTYDYILQNNQTNMEFLLARAERIGYQVMSAEGNLYFKKGGAAVLSGSTPELIYMESLFSFQPCWTAGHQADKMIVKSWDPKGKAFLTATKTPNASLNQGGMSGSGGDKAKQAFGASAEAVITDRPVFTVDEATALADGLSNDISRYYVQAEGVCAGHPGVKAGGKVKISKVGTRFSGDYFVTAAVHVMDANGYETRFNINGREPNTLSHLLNSGNGHGAGQGMIQGVVTALVTNVTDPDDLGRVKVKYSWLGTTPDGIEIESDWVRIAAPMAGPQRGMLFLPEINDEVLVAFEHGDVHRPYIVGALWNNTDKPPKKNSEATASGVVNQRVLKTRSGHLIILDDKQGEEQVSITSKSGHTVILDDKSGSEKITIKDMTGDNSMEINSTNNSMTINVNGDFNVTAKGKVNIKSTQNMTLESSAMNEIKAGGNLNVNATGNLTAKATGNLSLQGTGMTDLKGNMVTVDGGPMATIKGGLVKIN